MDRASLKNVGLAARLAVYVLVLITLFSLRGKLPSGMHSPFSAPDSSGQLTVAGLDVAPTLIPHLVDSYRRLYPRFAIRVEGGGTTQALEAVANRRSDVAFLSRPPTPAEQALFRSASGDTALWYPIALGGIILRCSSRSGLQAITMDALRSFIRDEPGTHFERLYVPEPNTGLWDAFLSRLGLPPETEADPARVFFLKGEKEVADAVARDPGGLGLLSSLPSTLAVEPNPKLRTLPVQASGEGTAVTPSYDDIAFGRYPLYQYVCVGCRQVGGSAAAMFVTYLVSNRGQRQVEHAGFFPSRMEYREVVLTSDQVGRAN